MKLIKRLKLLFQIIKMSTPQLETLTAFNHFMEIYAMKAEIEKDKITITFTDWS